MKLPFFTSAKFPRMDGDLGERVRARQIIQEVARAYDLRVEHLESASRLERHVEPRHLAMMLVRTHTDLSLHSIGELFGGRDHGTVVNAVNRVADRRSVNPIFDEAVKRLEVRATAVAA